MWKGQPDLILQSKACPACLFDFNPPKVKMNDKATVARIKEDGVKFVSFQFTDVTGSVKREDMPVDRLAGAI